MKSLFTLLFSCSSSVLSDKGFGSGPSSLGQYSSGGGGSFGAGGSFGGAFGAPGAGGSLEETIPGIPGDDYPIYAEIPDTSFFCDGQVDGGYYGDPEAECQAFHICASNGNGGLTQYSFLCPNGTLFQQQYFVCDWWFNVDCSTTEEFYSLNDEIAAEREANSPGGGGQGQYQGGGGAQYAGAGAAAAKKGNRNRSFSGPRGSGSSPRGSFSSPSSNNYQGPQDNFRGDGGFGSDGGYSAPGDFSAGSGYGAPGSGSLGGYSSSRRNARGAAIVSRSLGAPIENNLPVDIVSNEVAEEEE